jgi:hypothetical protein
MFERFTDSSRQVLVLAQEEARLLGHSFIGTEHLLLGLLRQDGATARVLTELGASLPTVRTLVGETIGVVGGPASGSPPFTPRAKKVLELSLREVQQLGGDNIGTEHILLGLIREGQGVAYQVLVGLGIHPGAIRQRVIQYIIIAHDSDAGGEAVTGPIQDLPGDDGVNLGKVVACSFCGLSPPASGQIVAGRNAFICERCVRQWSIRLSARSALPITLISPTPWDAVSPGGQPVDPDAARAQITAVFTNYGEVSEDGDTALGIENGGHLGWALKAVRANRQGYLDAEIVFTVDHIVFLDPDHAAVWFSISVNGTPVLHRHRGDAVVVDGAWNMAHATFSQLLAMGGVSLPPE